MKMNQTAQWQCNECDITFDIAARKLAEDDMPINPQDDPNDYVPNTCPYCGSGAIEFVCIVAS